MNRKRVFRIPLVVVLILMLGTLWTALQGGPLARSYAKLLFQQNRTDFDSAVSMGGSGLGSSTTYWGIQYVPSGERLGFQGSRLEGWISDGDGWRWEESGRARGWRAGFPTGTAGAGRRAVGTTAVTSRSWTSTGTTMRWNFRGLRP